jgi:hypothetical protein
MGETMTAEPTEQPHWPTPPSDGYTVDNLFTLPDLPPHTELIDGSLVFVSPQRNFHADVIDLLVLGLRRTLPRSHDRLKVDTPYDIDIDLTAIDEL